jgi:hypothetical protein
MAHGKLTTTLARWAVATALLGAAACEPLPLDPGAGTGRGVPGFDTSLYPGDAAMRAWAYPSSPYRWVGYYLQAPCHRDASWMGRRAALESMGWGLAVLYVGQQQWEGLAALLPGPAPIEAGGPARASISVAGQAVSCSRTLLTDEQGRAEAQDAVTKTAAQGFPAGSVIHLDIERVDRITPEMRTYYRAWLEGVLQHGRYVPGTYAHRFNAPDFYEIARDAFRRAGRAEVPPFWIAGGSGFSLERHPTDVGLPYASAWQGVLDVTRSWNGVSLRIDENVADRADPSAPLRR